MRYISQLSIGDSLVKKKDWIQIQHEQVDGIPTAVVYAAQLGREGELKLLTAIQVYA
jgi:hypothetical protein